MSDCVFCKIITGELDTKFEKETENLVVFRDIHPQAPLHLLIVPKKHYQDITEVENQVWQEIKDVAILIARSKGLTGFRIVNNAGDSAAIKHMHVHLLGEISVDRAV
ncbi:MAG: HIT domain-containing protein [Patescibacteria group bacterium]|nr:HIT domain-containing protein [Patescibacteria group bacterium]